MAKISELQSGGNLQQTDRLVVVRGNDNFMVQWVPPNTGGLTADQVRGLFATWAQVSNTELIPESKLPTAATEGLNETEVDARVRAGVSDWAEAGNSSQIPANKLGNVPAAGLNQTQVDARVAAGVADWAETGNTDEIPETKLPSSATEGLNQGEVDARVAAGVSDWAEEGNTSQIPLNKLGNAPSGGGGGGLTQAQVDARVQAGVEDWAETGNTGTIPNAKLVNATNQIEGFARVGRTDLIPDSRLPTSATEGLNQSEVDARVRAGVSNWAEQGNTDSIPAEKLNNAPGLNANQVQAETRLIVWDWAEANNNEDIPVTKLPTGEIEDLARTQISDWAEVGNFEPIPASKLTNAPSGGGGTGGGGTGTIETLFDSEAAGSTFTWPSEGSWRRVDLGSGFTWQDHQNHVIAVAVRDETGGDGPVQEFHFTGKTFSEMPLISGATASAQSGTTFSADAAEQSVIVFAGVGNTSSPISATGAEYAIARGDSERVFYIASQNNNQDELDDWLKVYAIPVGGGGGGGATGSATGFETIFDGSPTFTDNNFIRLDLGAGHSWQDYRDAEIIFEFRDITGGTGPFTNATISGRTFADRPLASFATAGSIPVTTYAQDANEQHVLSLLVLRATTDLQQAPINRVYFARADDERHAYLYLREDTATFSGHLKIYAYRAAGLTEAEVDARVDAGVADWAEAGNATLIPNNKLPADAGLSEAQVDARARAITADWAETGNTDLIPANKIPPAASGEAADVEIFSGTPTFTDNAVTRIDMGEGFSWQDYEDAIVEFEFRDGNAGVGPFVTKSFPVKTITNMALSSFSTDTVAITTLAIDTNEQFVMTFRMPSDTDSLVNLGLTRMAIVRANDERHIYVGPIQSSRAANLSGHLKIYAYKSGGGGGGGLTQAQVDARVQAVAPGKGRVGGFGTATMPVCTSNTTMTDNLTGDTYYAHAVPATTDFFLEPVDAGGGEHGLTATTRNAVAEAPTWLTRLTYADGGEITIEADATNSPMINSVRVYDNADPRVGTGAVIFRARSFPDPQQPYKKKARTLAFPPYPATGHALTATASSVSGRFPGWSGTTTLNWASNRLSLTIPATEAKRDRKLRVYGQRVKFAQVGNTYSFVIPQNGEDGTQSLSTARGSFDTGRHPPFYEVVIDTANPANSHIHAPVGVASGSSATPALAFFGEYITTPGHQDLVYAPVNPGRAHFLQRGSTITTHNRTRIRYTFVNPPANLASQLGIDSAVSADGWVHCALAVMDERSGSFGGATGNDYSVLPAPYSEITLDGIRYPVTTSGATMEQLSGNTGADAGIQYTIQSAAFHASAQAPIAATDTALRVNAYSENGVAVAGGQEYGHLYFPHWEARRIALLKADNTSMVTSGERVFWRLSNRSDIIPQVNALAQQPRGYERALHLESGIPVKYQARVESVNGLHGILQDRTAFSDEDELGGLLGQGDLNLTNDNDSFRVTDIRFQPSARQIHIEYAAPTALTGTWRIRLWSSKTGAYTVMTATHGFDPTDSRYTLIGTYGDDAAAVAAAGIERGQMLVVELQQGTERRTVTQLGVLWRRD